MFFYHNQSGPCLLGASYGYKCHFCFRFIIVQPLYFSCYYKSTVFFTKPELTYTKLVPFTPNTKKQHKHQLTKLKLNIIPLKLLAFEFLKLVSFAHVVMKIPSSFFLRVDGVAFHLFEVVMETVSLEWGEW